SLPDHESSEAVDGGETGGAGSHQATTQRRRGASSLPFDFASRGLPRERHGGRATHGQGVHPGPPLAQAVRAKREPVSWLGGGVLLTVREVGRSNPVVPF